MSTIISDKAARSQSFAKTLRAIDKQGIELNIGNIAKAIAILEEVKRLHGRFDMEELMHTAGSVVIAPKPELNAWSVDKIIKEHTACGSVGCVAGWLSVCMQSIESLGVHASLNIYAFSLFVMQKYDYHTVHFNISICLRVLLFQAEWAQVAPTIDDAIVRLRWLQTKTLKEVVTIISGLKIEFPGMLVALNKVIRADLGLPVPGLIEQQAE